MFGADKEVFHKFYFASICGSVVTSSSEKVKVKFGAHAKASRSFYITIGARGFRRSSSVSSAFEHVVGSTPLPRDTGLL